ncbi:MAG: hypothetical protein ACLS4Z_04405 [Christensenellaceae bacterium]
MRIIRLEETDSTNIYAKARLEGGGEPRGYGAPTDGRQGHQGQKLRFPRRGVYLSRLFFWLKMPVTEAFRIMANASVAVCRTLKTTALRRKSSGSNDVYVQGKRFAESHRNIFRG